MISGAGSCAPIAPFQFKKDRAMLVRKGRLELPRVAPLAPKASASTNSATFAIRSNRYCRVFLRANIFTEIQSTGPR